MSVQRGTRLIVFDAALWAGLDVGNNEQFWKPATVQQVYRCHVDQGEWMVDVVFDHRPGMVSCGHFLAATRGVPFEAVTGPRPKWPPTQRRSFTWRMRKWGRQQHD